MRSRDRDVENECNSCGVLIDDGVDFCETCGDSIERYEEKYGVSI